MDYVVEKEKLILQHNQLVQEAQVQEEAARIAKEEAIKLRGQISLLDRLIAEGEQEGKEAEELE